MKTITLAGREVPALGQGTWKMGESQRTQAHEIAALRHGIDLGMTLIDTAEMYAEGGAEQVVGEAIQGRRDQIFLVSKVYPHNATKLGTAAACERSLKRLRVDSLDLYLLHWPGSTPIDETLEAFTALKEAGKIRSFGVSNFNVDGMEEAWRVAGSPQIATNQVLYNLTRRGIEFDLLPWCESHDIGVMAYSPVEQGKLLTNPALTRLAKERDATPAQLALAWVLSRDNVVAMPKSSSTQHLTENRQAADLELTPAEIAALDRAFPAPKKKRALEML